MDRGAGGVEWEIPAVAGGVPEKFVVILVETQLAVGGVGDGVDVAAEADDRIGIAEVDAFAVELVFDAKLFLCRIASGCEHLETDNVAIVIRICICRGEIAEDSVADLLAGAVYRDGFGHLQRAVVFERDVAVVVEDAFSRSARGDGGRQAEASNQQKPNWSGDSHGTRCIQCRASWMN